MRRSQADFEKLMRSFNSLSCGPWNEMPEQRNEDVDEARSEEIQLDFESERSFSSRLTIIAGCMAMLASVCQMTGAHAAAQHSDSKESDSIVQMSWRSSCAKDSGTEFFSVTVHQDGLVRYRGSSDTRVKGEQTRRISGDSANSFARDIAEHPKITVHSTNIAGKASSSLYCISIVGSDGQLVQIGDGTSRFPDQTYDEVLRQLRSLELLAEEYLDFEQWACPSRAGELRATRFCGEPPLFFSFENERPCGYHHILYIYPQGLMQYYVPELPGEEYMVLSQEQMKLLQDVTRQFGSTDDGVVDTWDEQTRDAAPRSSLEDWVAAEQIRRTYTSPDKVLTLRDHIQQVTGISWQALAAVPEKTCHPRRRGYRFPQGWISAVSPF